ncbi:hypothetical protein HPP92_018712 [Vanilla planifolia]|uniref:Uncharacterized protein n=1 Tax=Vanilla planifolia TaxID=51239 RepID=A0A835QBL5_VANPL|nr:hypothetical protein HPP92_018712 [Vanilla planifolia]
MQQSKSAAFSPRSLPSPTLGIAAIHRRNWHGKPEEIKRELLHNSNMPPSSPQRSSLRNWARWILGTFLATTLPFWDKSWKRISRMEDEVEMVTDAVEAAAEVVEKVAVATERVSSDIAEKMPKDGGFKDALLLVGKVAKEAAEEAHLAQDIIHKVDELKEEMEAMIAPIGRKKTPNKEEIHNRGT